MKYFRKILVLAVLISLPLNKCGAGEPPKELVEKLTAVIRKHCPEAKISLTNQMFQASHGTMVFTIHEHNMTGEVQRMPRQEEGPNYKGFLLRVRVEDGAYEGQLHTPQTLQGPYYPTFIATPPMADGKSHYLLSFSYGSRVDEGLKNAVFAALPQQFVKK